MFMNDVNKKEEIRNIALQDLRSFGIKFRNKKQRHHVQESKTSRRVFKTALKFLPVQTVTLTSGQQLVVPKLVHDLCSFILTKVKTEGLFRKGGSKARQNEIRLSLDAGCYLGDEHHEVDVANVLKTFFRELPEPLFPYQYHEVFLRSVLLGEKKLEAVLLACLLLPTEHLNTLAYIMQFLYHVTEYSAVNKMDAYNLAVIIGPTLLPMEEKLAPNATLRLAKVCELFKLLIENATSVGLLSENVIDRIASLSPSPVPSTEEDAAIKKKKKRRSGSLTRMFNGLKKIVGNKVGDEVTSQTPDILMTPRVVMSAKKRKMESAGFSNKKKRDLIQKLPQATTLSTLFTPKSTPVSVHPNPKKISPPESSKKSPPLDFNKKTKEKKSHWNLGTKRNKQPKQNEDAASIKSLRPKTMLERRWSAVSQAAGFKRNKKQSSTTALMTLPQHQIPHDVLDRESATQDNEKCDINSLNNDDDVLKMEPDYVKISRTEYEEIENRVSAIERRISLELDVDESTLKKNKTNAIENIQTAYEKTLVEAEPLSPTTDQLARRLSKELKIRRSLEQKVFRSPSARKIGSLRRRSRELERQSARIHRTRSWHVDKYEIIPRIALKRGKPNTVLTGLPTPSQTKELETTNSYQLYGVDLMSPGMETLESRRVKQTRTSFHGRTASSPIQKPKSLSTSQVSFNLSNNSHNSMGQKWVSAEGFFRNVKTPNNLDNCRPSLAKLRSQNAGMVLAKAKLFDEILDSDNSQNTSEPLMIPSMKAQMKICSLRNPDNRVPYRFKTLRLEEKRLPKKSMSPRKRNIKSPNCSQFQRLQISKQTETSTPKNYYNEKENDFNGLNAMGDILTSEKVLGVLKDCNRIGIPEPRLKPTSPAYVTPKVPPRIKKTLNTSSPKRLCRTPLHNENKSTPLKPLMTSNNRY